jgi:hypothetical protein
MRSSVPAEAAKYSNVKDRRVYFITGVPFGAAGAERRRNAECGMTNDECVSVDPLLGGRFLG